jgi:membrane-associated phospholipid phosphatase
MTVALIAVALVAFVLFFALGRAMDHSSDPAWLFGMEHQLVNHSTLIAWWLTWFGFVYALVPLCIVTLVVTARSPSWRVRAIFAIVTVLLAWQGADHFQHYFGRPRRLDWVVKHELAFSYPSSHAAIVAGFYWVWALLLARSSLRYKAVAASVLAFLGLGILWSRLALGAHYVTDIVGGVLWGVVVVTTAAAIAPINVFERQGEASLE